MEITYLIGAGASCKVLPLVKNFPDRMNGFLSKLENYFIEVPTSIDTVKLFEYKKEFVKDMKWLIKESQKHASIDTFAKKLFLTNSTEKLNKLKATLTVHLIFEQIENKIDDRYDTFFASILKSKYTDFPNNIKILSWNYDNQFELSYNAFSNYGDLHSNQNELNVLSKFHQLSQGHDKFTIIKLNGSLGILNERNLHPIEIVKKIHNELNIKLIFEYLKYHDKIKNPEYNFSALSFAWEQKSDSGNIIEVSKKSTKETKVLVIIGYSFPFFNREVDREIISNMEKLEKVYIQDPFAENIRDRFFSVRNDVSKENIKLIKDTEQFFLPNEL